MKRLFFIWLIAPFFSFSQNRLCFSADAGVNFGQSVNHTGYGLSVGANKYLSNRIAAGISTGVVKLNPLAEKISIPLSARVSYDGSTDETKTFPLFSLEGGKLFHRQENFGGVSTHTFQGRYQFLAAAGIGIGSESSLKSTITIGFAGYYYRNEMKNGNSETSVAYNLHRIVLRVGLMLLR